MINSIHCKVRCCGADRGGLATSTACPFHDAYHFVYSNSSGGFCRNPVSYVRPCSSPSRLVFHFRRCSDAAYSYDQGLLAVKYKQFGKNCGQKSNKTRLYIRVSPANQKRNRGCVKQVRREPQRGPGKHSRGISLEKIFFEFLFLKWRILVCFIFRSDGALSKTSRNLG